MGVQRRAEDCPPYLLPPSLRHYVIEITVLYFLKHRAYIANVSLKLAGKWFFVQVRRDLNQGASPWDQPAAVAPAPGTVFGPAKRGSFLWNPYGIRMETLWNPCGTIREQYRSNTLATRQQQAFSPPSAGRHCTGSPRPARALTKQRTRPRPAHSQKSSITIATIPKQRRCPDHRRSGTPFAGRSVTCRRLRRGHGNRSLSLKPARGQGDRQTVRRPTLPGRCQELVLASL